MGDVVRIVLEPGQRLEVTYVEPAAQCEPSKWHTLDELPVSPKAARALIRKGKLPATKTGRQYLVLREDVDRVFAPKVATPPEKKTRKSSSDRVRDRLRAAGIAVGQ